MTWLTPTIAAIAAAVAVPTLVILYFLKLRRRDVEISSTLLWKKSIQDLQANAPFQKLRRNILLLLQLVALAAALFAVAQPELAGDSDAGTRHIILIDRSASMSARDESAADGSPTTRLEKAKELALSLIDSLREASVIEKTLNGKSDEAMVIVFGAGAESIQSFTSDKTLLRAAVRAVEPTDSSTSVESAFALARAQAPKRFYRDTRSGSDTVHELPGGPVGTIHLFTDGRFPDAAKADLAPEDAVVYHKVGKTETSNIAITSLRAQRRFDNPQRLEIFAGLQSTDRSARTVQVELQIDGQLVQRKPVEFAAAKVERVAAGEAGSAKDTPVERVTPDLNGVVFTLDRPQGAIVTVVADTPATESLREDDRAFLVVPPSKQLSVAIVSRGDFLMRSAIEALPLAKLDSLTPEQFETYQDRVRQNQAPPYDIVVLDRYLPRGSAGVAPAATAGKAPAAPAPDAPPLPPGRWLVFGAIPGGTQGLVDKGSTYPSVILDWNRERPALRGIVLDTLEVAEMPLIEIPRGSPARVIATAERGPAILELLADNASAIVVPFDLYKSNWIWDLSYVAFMVQAIESLGDDAAGAAQFLRPGQTLADTIPPGGTELEVRLPGGKAEPMGPPTPDGRVFFAPILRAGVYTLSWRGSPGTTDAKQGDRALRPFAANLLDPSESNIAAADSIALPTKVATAEAQATTRSATPLWPFLLLAMLAFLLLEWFVYNRKVHL